MNPIINIEDSQRIYGSIPRDLVSPGVRIIVYNNVWVEIRETCRDLVSEWLLEEVG